MDLSKVFDYQGYKVRTVVVDGAIWFVAKDVCDVLEIGNHTMALRRLDDDEKGVNSIESLGGNQAMSIVSESGLYSLILTSRKVEAKRFKKWVTSEVLPEIRKTGAFTSKNLTSAEMLVAQAQELVAHERRLAEHSAKIQDVTERVEILEGGKLPSGYMTVIRYASKYKIKVNNAAAQKVGKAATAICKARGIVIHYMEDNKFHSVGAYPEYVLTETFRTELSIIKK